MADINISTLNGWLKEKYGANGVVIIPEENQITKEIVFDKNEKVGKEYVQSIVVSRSHGHAYGGENGDAFDLSEATPFKTEDARVKPSATAHQEIISEVALSRSADNKQAFGNLAELVQSQMRSAFSFKNELSFMYGGLGIAKTSAKTSVDATHTKITIDLADFAVGIWAGIEGADLQFYNGATLISTGADSIFVVDSVDLATRVITLSGTATGITALEAAITAGTIDVYFNNQYGKECVGIEKIISNTGSLFGIDAATYSVWRGNTYNVGGQLTLGHVLKASANAVGRGAKGNQVLYINPEVFEQLNSDEAALRNFDNSYDSKKLKRGTNSIEYFGQTGTISIRPHIYMKRGKAFLLADPSKKENWRRIGSSDMTNKMSNGELTQQHQSRMAIIMRLFADMAIFSPKPSHNVLLTGIA